MTEYEQLRMRRIIMLLLFWTLFFLSAEAMSTINNKASSARVIRTTFSSSSSSGDRRIQKGPRPMVPRRALEPPFPNGKCGGTVVTYPPEDTYGIDVNLANINLGGDLILPPRPIQVWLPPDYHLQGTNNYDDEDGIRRSVLYVHDGQNAMEDSSSWTGASWRLIGALTRMADHQCISHLPIVVLLPSAEGDFMPGIRRRHLEYGDSNFPFAQAHVDFVAKTVKPLIDSSFRTNPSPEHTFTIGSSLGGQASLHLLLRYPNLFGGAACMSPAFGPNILDEVSRSSEILRSKRIYLDIGGDVDQVKVPLLDLMDHMTMAHWWNPGYFWLDTQLRGSVNAMRRALDQGGVEYSFRQCPGARHNERAWAQRIDKPLLHLLQPLPANKQKRMP